MFRRISKWWNDRKSPSSSVSSSSLTDSSPPLTSPEYVALRQRWEFLNSEAQVLRDAISEIKDSLPSRKGADKKEMEDLITTKEEQLWEVLGEKIRVGKQLQALQLSEQSSPSPSASSSESVSEIETALVIPTASGVSSRRFPVPRLRGKFHPRRDSLTEGYVQR